MLLTNMQQGRSQDLSGGFFYGLGGPNLGVRGALPRKNFGFKVPQPQFFLVLLVQGDKKGSRFPQVNNQCFLLY